MEFGRVFFYDSASCNIFSDIINDINLKSPVIIKPNWGTSICYTEAKILDWVLTSVEGEAIVVESYGWARSREAIKNKRVGSKKKKDLRESNQWFLKNSGIGEILKKHNVEYINITEEFWAKRTAEPELVKQLVEEKFSPIQTDEMYSQVPTRLFELQGGSLLSLAKIKIWYEPIIVSFSIKNLFGMIPGPGRTRFHGKQYSCLDQSIIDINKIYRALFSVKGIVEAVFTASNGEKKPMEPDINQNRNLVLGSKDTVELDAFTTVLVGKDPNKVGHLKLAAKNFGRWNESTISSCPQGYF